MNKAALFFDVDSTLYTHRVHDLPASTKDLLIKAKKISAFPMKPETGSCAHALRWAVSAQER